MLTRTLTKLVTGLFITVLLISVLTSGGALKNEANEYYYHRNGNNKIALTFDDGPHPIYTLKILDLLDKYNIKATFFIIGQNAVNYKETLKEIIKRGHEIGNHTFNHKVIKDLSTQEIIYEVEECRRTIYEISGENTVLFRPPGGFVARYDPEDAEILDGYDIILWSIDTLDWAHNSPEGIYGCVSNEIKSGDIILMHDYIGYDSPTPEALELIIPDLINKGYEFVTVSELLSE